MPRESPVLELKMWHTNWNPKRRRQIEEAATRLGLTLEVQSFDSGWFTTHLTYEVYGTETAAHELMVEIRSLL